MNSGVMMERIAEASPRLKARISLPLLNGVNKTHASLMVTLALVSVPSCS
jgi:hypothetical protein